MTKKYGGYTAAELREGIARDDDFHAGVVRDLLDALSAPQAPVTDAARAEPVAFGPAVNMPWTPEQEKALDAALDRVFEKPEAPTQQPARASEGGEAHFNDKVVDAFAAAMKGKLADARGKGRSGWQHVAPGVLSQMLREHVEKGDPRDVANFCMFLWYHGASISPTAQQAVTLTDDEWKRAVDDELIAIGSTTDSFGSPRVAVRSLINWHIATAHDPAVSEVARDAARWRRIECALKEAQRNGDLSMGVEMEFDAVRDAADVAARTDDARELESRIPEGWQFYSADFSGAPAWGRVMLIRDAAGQKAWHALSEEQRDATNLFLIGQGNTLAKAIDAAMKSHEGEA